MTLQVKYNKLENDCFNLLIVDPNPPHDLKYFSLILRLENTASSRRDCARSTNYYASAWRAAWILTLRAVFVTPSRQLTSARWAIAQSLCCSPVRPLCTSDRNRKSDTRRPWPLWQALLARSWPMAAARLDLRWARSRSSPENV